MLVGNIVKLYLDQIYIYIAYNNKEDFQHNIITTKYTNIMGYNIYEK